jgi:hypothetical protein
MNIFIQILTALFVTAFYAYFLTIFSRQFATRRAERYFFHAVMSVLENNQDTYSCIDQIDINFRRITERHPRLSREMITAVDLLETFFSYYDTAGGKKFKSEFKLDFKPEYRKRISDIINIMKQRNPFASLSPDVANNFADLNHAIETQNSELGKRSIRQLAEQSRIMINNLKKQERRNNTTMVIAIAGAFLTFFFGVMAFFR